MSKLTLVTLAVLLVTASEVRVLADGDCEVFAAITKLESSPNPLEAREISRTVDKHLEKLARSLVLAIARTESEPAKVEICYLAGRLRAGRLTDTLIDNIIGEPALSEVIYRISLLDAGTQQDFLVRTLVEITHGPEAAVGKIEDTIFKFDGAGQRRLMAAEDEIRSAGIKK